MNDDSLLAFIQCDDKKNDMFTYSNAKFWLKLFFIISGWETVIMLTLSVIKLDSAILETCIDIISLTICSAISISLLIFRPNKKKIQNQVADATFFLKQQLIAINKVAIISATNKNGEITFVNENFCKTSGFAREELLGRDNNISNSGYHSKDFFNEMWNTLLSGKIWKGKICNKTKTGELYWVDTSLVPLFDKNNSLTNYISIRFDITTEIMAENVLEQEKLKNIHLGRLASLGELATGIAHEINNPITIIDGLIAYNAKDLKRRIDVNENTKIFENFEKCHRNIDRIAKIINGLKSFSRLDSNDDMDNIKISELIDNIKLLCDEKLKNMNVSLKLEIKKEFLECRLKCHHVQIEQVLVNLINNSIDAMVDLKEKWIEVEVLSLDNTTELRLTDAGQGVSKAIANKIMQPFFTTKPIGKGTGLGLSISRGIIERHGGKFFLDQNSLNTRFVIQLPNEQSAASVDKEQKAS